MNLQINLFSELFACPVNAISYEQYLAAGWVFDAMRRKFPKDWPKPEFHPGQTTPQFPHSPYPLKLVWADVDHAPAFHCQPDC